MGDQSCLDRESLANSLDRIKAALHDNGSSLELIAVEGSSILVIFEGRVIESFSSVMLLKIGMERALKKEVPGFGEVLIESR